MFELASIFGPHRNGIGLKDSLISVLYTPLPFMLDREAKALRSLSLKIEHLTIVMGRGGEISVGNAVCLLKNLNGVQF